MNKNFFLYVMVAFYVFAGINHFANPDFYLGIIPSWMPYPVTTNYITGAFEIIFALLLIPPGIRPFAAWMIIALLIAVFPANIQMTMNYWEENNPHLWITIARLPFQILLIWWAWKYTR
jgi:uncharacterized membrane protein